MSVSSSDGGPRSRSAECEAAIPLLEAIRTLRPALRGPVDSRIERGRTPRHALKEAIEHERYDRVVVPAATATGDGFSADDVAWLLESAPGEVVVLRHAVARLES